MPVNDEKREYAAKLNRLLDTYSKVMFCTLDNVRSQQLHDVRRGLRGKGEFLMGKKTMQKKIISLRAASSSSQMDQALKKTLVDDQFLSGNLGLLFTNESIDTIHAIVSKHRVQAPARVGAVAPCDVIIPAGNTGLEPTQTSFFQVLNIPTKIAKGMVEIVSDKKVLSAGDKVDNSTAALLQKLKISPFFYSVEVVSLWDRGVLFTADDLKINDAALEASMLSSISNLTALSLGSGVLTELSFPHAVLDGFKNLLGAAVATDYTFTEFDGAATIKAIKEGKVTAAPAAAAAPKAAAAPAAAKKPEPEPEEEEDLGLFF
jgi:large subunit ribosomal protein LP0